MLLALGVMTVDTEVAIVGGGPVGLCLALELGWRGVDCIVLEARAQAGAVFPTANHISVRTMEQLRRLGVSEDVASVFPAEWGGDWIGITHIGGFEVARIEDALSTAAALEDSYWNGSESLASTVLGLAAYAQLGVEGRPGTPSRDELNARGELAVRRLLELQNHEGGFGMWSSSDYTRARETAFALHALQAAERAGFEGRYSLEVS